MVVARFQQWLSAVPIRDPIERRLSPLIQIALLALSAAAAATVVMGLVTSGAAALRLEALTPTLLFIGAMLLALVVLRRGHFRAALVIITGATLIAQTRNTLSADLSGTGSAILMGYTIPIALAGLLINQRALLLVLAISALGVHAAALRDIPEPGLAAGMTLFFLIIFGLLSFLLALFNRAFRVELTASLARADELAQLSERLRVTLTSIGDAVITTDKTGRVVLMNTVAQQMTGWTQTEAEGQPLHTVFHIINEYTREPVESPVDKVLREGAIVGLANHTILQAKDGREIPIDDSGAPIRDHAGVMTGVVLVFRDISERHAAEQEAARLFQAELQARQDADRSREQVTRILESITDAYYGLDRDWNFTYVNQEAERVLGRKRETLIGKNIWDELPSALDTPLPEAYKRALRDGETVGVEFYDPPLQSWFDLRAYPSKDGLFVYFRNINERKQAEAALRQSEQTAWRQVAEIEAIYNTAPVGLGVLDTALRFQRINQHLAEINGIPPNDHLGRSVREMLPDLAATVEPLFNQIIATGEPLLNYELSGETPALPGVQRFWVEHWLPLKDQTGQVIGVNIVTEEITERKRMEAAEREQRLLAESQRDMAIAINSTLDLNEVVDRILDSVRRVVPHDAGVVMLVEDGLASVQRTRGLEFDPALRDETENLDLPVQETAALREMVEHRQPLIIPDLNTYPGWVRAGQPDEPRPFAGFIGAPVYLRDELIGFVNLFCRESDAFTNAHAERLRLFAEAIATAIQNARLYQQAQEAAAYEERQRLARDLHDAVSQTLFSATTVAESLPRLWQRNPQKTMEQLDQLVLLNRAAMAEMRTLLLELRPEVILSTRLSKLLTQLVEVVKGRKRMTGELELQGELDTLPPAVHLAFYRIAQESLNNVLKHSQATQFRVRVERQPGRLCLEVHDNGRGFNVKEAGGGFGLSTMQERANAIGAALEMTSRPNQGTAVVVTWLDATNRRVAAGE